MLPCSSTPSWSVPRGRPEAKQRSHIQRGAADWRKSSAGEPGSVLDAAMCRVAPELHRQPKTPHAPAADKDSERCIKRTNLLIWTIRRPRSPHRHRPASATPSRPSPPATRRTRSPQAPRPPSQKAPRPRRANPEELEAAAAARPTAAPCRRPARNRPPAPSNKGAAPASPRGPAASPPATPPAATAARGPPGAYLFLSHRQISRPRRPTPATRFARRRRAAARRTMQSGAPTRGSPSCRPNGRTRRRRRLRWRGVGSRSVDGVKSDGCGRTSRADGVGSTRYRAATHSVVKRRRVFTDAAAAPSDASQSSVASDQLRTKKGARLRQAAKPASAASPPAWDA